MIHVLTTCRLYFSLWISHTVTIIRNSEIVSDWQLDTDFGGTFWGTGSGWENATSLVVERFFLVPAAPPCDFHMYFKPSCQTFSAQLSHCYLIVNVHTCNLEKYQMDIFGDLWNILVYKCILCEQALEKKEQQKSFRLPSLSRPSLYHEVSSTYMYKYTCTL